MKALATTFLSTLVFISMAATPAAAPDDAAAFGALPFFYSVALSADGSRLVAVGPGKGATSHAIALDLVGKDAGKTRSVLTANGEPLNLTSCGWSALDRVVCRIYGLTHIEGTLAPVTRTIAVDVDGGNALTLGQSDSMRQLYMRQFDGGVIDWGDGVAGKVLMEQTNVPEFSTGTRLARSAEGLSVAQVDTRTGKARTVEKAFEDAIDYLPDGRGAIRMMTTTKTIDGQLTGNDTHLYRTAGDREWKTLGTNNSQDDGMIPLAVDPISNVAYVLRKLDGRFALYRIALDGSMKSELAFASPEADVEDVVRMGRSGRVIGVTWTTDREQVEYFDADYKKVAATLARALPKLPLIRFISASADEQVLLVWAGSDVDPGHLYRFDRTKKSLEEVTSSRPALDGRKLSAVRAITYPAADGTPIPGYLTLPPGLTEAKGLPAIVMPHGGPAARDAWGFDWLAQFFAQQGFAVLQPNFRGSWGYGERWFVENGFKSWKTAIGDVCDAGRWLVAQGADGSKLAILGWSYGGYAALQANVLAPDLFKAVVAVAPVTDMAMAKQDAQGFAKRELVEAYIGNGPHITEGSPARNAEAFKAPVLMFHGDQDINVGVEQSQRMDERLRDAGKRSELVVYPKLDHSLRDSTVRADLLRKSEAFLRRTLGL